MSPLDRLRDWNARRERADALFQAQKAFSYRRSYDAGDVVWALAAITLAGAFLRCL